MILADFGADVIKVERIDGGDDARGMGPHRGEWGAYFVPINRGKRSIAINVTKPEGRELVLRLARSADVFVENFRGGKAAALGLDEAAVRAVKPDIIYGSLSAYGQRGPDATKPGYDPILQARSGIVSVTGTDADNPIRAGVSILDIGAGVWMALGIVTALLERQKSGKGQRVDTSLLQTGVMLMCYHLLYRQFSGVNPEPAGSRHAGFAPYGAFPTTDGAIVIGVSNDRLFRRLCTALGRVEWLEDPRYSSNALRVENRETLEGDMANVIKTQSTTHWAALFDQHDVPNDIVQNAGQVLCDPQIAAMSGLAEIALAGQDAANVPRLPVELSLTSSAISLPPPALNEHASAILREAGCSDADIEALTNAGVCIA